MQRQFNYIFELKKSTSIKFLKYHKMKITNNIDKLGLTGLFITAFFPLAVFHYLLLELLL
ncbi:hypothetical protein SAMN05444366_2914 [Flavobacterium saccharophilum]|jgi:hypothetical protein|uniref:Uncharacterized protein n=1 Tax=Flavobacterium saccharophilum TaxID=29534 RepID=A0A1M7HX44_9FLAO|nr:hypothetical protein SAMN05444366_2914 [Flavobacterium saccharophilum]